MHRMSKYTLFTYEPNTILLIGGAHYEIQVSKNFDEQSTSKNRVEPSETWCINTKQEPPYESIYMSNRSMELLI